MSAVIETSLKRLVFVCTTAACLAPDVVVAAGVQDCGDCDTPHSTPGCSDAECEAIVCALDPYCCQAQWDYVCTVEAGYLCPDCGPGPCQSDDDCAADEVCVDGRCVESGCPLACPGCDLKEGEACGDDANGGCNSDPPIFMPASCGDTFCGTGWAIFHRRDTDWYVIDHAGGVISATLTSQFPGVCYIVGGVGPGGVPCDPYVAGDVGCSDPCQNLTTASADMPPGIVVVFVAVGECAGSGIWDGFPCGGANDYVVAIGCGPQCQSDGDCPPGQVCMDGVCVCPPPPNDHCPDVIPLDVGPGGAVTVEGTTNGATIDGTDCVTPNTAGDVWYTVVGNGNTMTASTCNQADYDTRISVFCGECPTGPSSDCCIANGTPGCDDPECVVIICGIDPFCCDVAWDGICADEALELCPICQVLEGLICVNGNDDTPGCGGATTEVTWCARANADYLILVHGSDEETGDFTLTVSDSSQPCTPDVDCPCPCASDEDCPPGFECDCACVPIPTGRLDIKPGSCPNSFNRNRRGVLPVALVGTDGLVATDVDLSSLHLSRADGVGGSVAPHAGPPGPHTVLDDVATPFDGGPCACHQAAGDGVMDVSMKFSSEELVEVLELGDLPGGSMVELALTGSLTNGQSFEARDCLRLVPDAVGDGVSW
jgi:hypothetical protein